MNGIEKIVQRIADDAATEAQGIVNRAKGEAGDILAAARAEAQAQREEALAQAGRTAEENAARARSMTQLEGRKRILQAKQEVIALAFDKALESLRTADKAQQIELLGQMAARASVTGRESVLFSEADREAIGAQVVARANEILAKKAAPQLPQEITQGKLGAILESAATVVSAIAKGTAMLTLSSETRPITGGFILESEGVELNCAYETLVRLSRNQLERETAQILFGA